VENWGWISERKIDWLLLNANLAILQLYCNENKLIFNGFLWNHAGQSLCQPVCLHSVILQTANNWLFTLQYKTYHITINYNQKYCIHAQIVKWRFCFVYINNFPRNHIIAKVSMLNITPPIELYQQQQPSNTAVTLIKKKHI
jgi:hypothetical protein